MCKTNPVKDTYRCLNVLISVKFSKLAKHVSLKGLGIIANLQTKDWKVVNFVVVHRIFEIMKKRSLS